MIEDPRAMEIPALGRISLYGEESIWWGLPRRLDRQDGEALLKDLTAAWNGQVGGSSDASTARTHSTLGHDLRALKTYFDPLASGTRLRKVLHQLPELEATSRYMRDPLALQVDTQKWIVTPEGRILMEVLRTQGPGNEPIALRSQDFFDAQSLLLKAYRTWTQQKIRSVVALQRGEGEPLRAQGIAAILFLLMNGSVGRQRAIFRPTDPQAFDVVDEAIKQVLGAFVSSFAEKASHKRPVNLSAFSIYSGYALTEAARRLGGELVNDKGVIYLRDGARPDIEKRLYQELIRRDPGERARAVPAFMAMRRAYGRAKPTLAAYRMAYERPTDTEDLQRQLQDAVGAA